MSRIPSFNSAFASILIVGCASNPPLVLAPTAAEQVQHIDGKEYNFNLSGGVARQISGASDPVMGYVGLAYALQPFAELCNSAGGRPFVEDKTLAGPNLVPTRIRCSSGAGTLWQLVIQYDNVRVKRLTNIGESTWLWLTPRIRYQNAEHVEEQRRIAVAEKNQARAMAAEMERIEAPRRAREAAELEARVDNFRRTLKSGDLFSWIEPTRRIQAYGTVVRFEGEMVFVQFENLRIGGGNTRYLRRSELLPWDGKRAGVNYQIE
jgi:hypothetical protein